MYNWYLFCNFLIKSSSCLVNVKTAKDTLRPVCALMLPLRHYKEEPLRRTYSGWWPTGARVVALITAKPSHLEYQPGEAERERVLQEADAESSLLVSRETPCQVLWQINPKSTQTKRSYMICIPHQARQVLPLIIYSWVHGTRI